MKLYHGTSRSKAKKILESGFARSKKPSYTGTGVNLSECMTISYEYGSYENNGCVLEVELNDDANIFDMGFNGTPSDDMFKDDPTLDVIKSYGGNVWVAWNMDMIKAIRIIPKREAVNILYKEFEKDGSNCAYNGFVQDHCDTFWENKSTKMESD